MSSRLAAVYPSMRVCCAALHRDAAPCMCGEQPFELAARRPLMCECRLQTPHEPARSVDYARRGGCFAPRGKDAKVRAMHAQYKRQNRCARCDVLATMSPWPPFGPSDHTPLHIPLVAPRIEVKEAEAGQR